MPGPEQPMRTFIKRVFPGGRACLSGLAAVCRRAGLLAGDWCAAWGARALVLRLYLASKRAWRPDSLHPSLRRGRGCSRSETGLARGDASFAPDRRCVPAVVMLPGRSPPGRAAAPGGDVRVPGHAAGDDGVNLADQRRGDRGAGLLVGDRVLGPSGQLGVPGGIDPVMTQRSPDRPPGGQPQRGPAAAGDTRLAGVVAAGVLARPAGRRA